MRGGTGCGGGGHLSAVEAGQLVEKGEQGSSLCSRLLEVAKGIFSGRIEMVD